jgi:hypothetical protein
MNLKRRLTRLEASAGIGEARIHGVWFVDVPEKAHTPAPDQMQTSALWGSGPDTWRVYLKPCQSEDDALRAVGIDPDKDHVIHWGMSDL